ncbi:MAG: hypothetical protein SOH99_07810 [Acidipropionibacterium acidipropionici]|jgi:hypothetical protein|uniref:Uncharacterized protein n=1 Tax=Acidipropionibacterium acidipropionici TaxID=1748 RepID=A0AAC8YCX1_9ACTN|nr:hypothetical protein [Acidipropionibacterium acidipropionici]AMS04188.1 hypothetical protein AXH35_00490 [Acidipropionibacterium acidipropionici]AOZ45684.1 hypothetical protein A8L58_01960 [Acidipropionibacterium acidipropionici]AZP38308.1 hypothetical protein DUY81_11320 [Acidipropionibacterium acidipropionici]
MSLAVPYLLDAAARTVPEADVAVADDHMTVSELDRRSIAEAEALLQKGLQTGNRMPLPAMGTAGRLVSALSAIRIGLVLCEDAAPASDRAVGAGADRDVVESRIWSQTPAAIIGSRTVTHGQVIQAVQRGDLRDLEPLRPLLELLGHIWTAAAAAPSADPNVGSGHEDR